MVQAKPRASRAVPAVTRAIQILRLLRVADEPMSLSEFARALNLVPSTCLHILRVLAEEGLVSFNPATKRYRLGLGLLTFSNSVLRQNPFAQAVQPTLDRIGQDFRVTTFAIERGPPDRLSVVAVSENLQTFSVRILVGTTFSALASASGRCVAGYENWDEAERRRRFEELRWQNAPSYEDWCRQVAEARANGYGLDVGNFFRGAVIVSAPISGDQGPASRFLAAVGLIDQLGRSRLARLAETLKTEAAAFAIEPPNWPTAAERR